MLIPALRTCTRCPKIFLPKCATFFTYATNRIHRNVPQCCIEMKNLCLTRPKITLLRQFSSDTNKTYYLPQLTDLPLNLYTPPWYFLLGKYHSEYKIKNQVDSDFNMSEFHSGCVQGMIMVSQALANQNYEILQDLIKPSTLKSLESRINPLHDEERKLIAIKSPDSFTFMNIAKCDVIKHPEDDNIETTVALRILACYMTTEKVKFQNGLEMCVCCYEFERKYKEREASQWLISDLNHASVKSVFASI